jgi:hypothetical protein
VVVRRDFGYQPTAEGEGPHATDSTSSACRSDGLDCFGYNRLCIRPRTGSDLRSNLPGMPPDLSGNGRLLFRVWLHIDGSMPGVGVRAFRPVRGQSLLQAACQAWSAPQAIPQAVKWACCRPPSAAVCAGWRSAAIVQPSRSSRTVHPAGNEGLTSVGRYDLPEGRSGED